MGSCSRDDDGDSDASLIERDKCVSGREEREREREWGERECT